MTTTQLDRVFRELNSQGKAFVVSKRTRIVWAMLRISLTTCTMVSYGVFIASPHPIIKFLAETVAVGGAFFLITHFGHEAAHGILTRSHRLNHLIKFFVFGLLGVDGELWRRRHVYAHHVQPNVAGFDPDLDGSVLLRFSPNAALRTYHRYQHFYAWFLYACAPIITIVAQDVVHLVSVLKSEKKREYWPLILTFMGTKILFALLWIIFPILYGGLSFPLTLLFLCGSLAPLGFLFFPIAASHLFVGASFPEGKEGAGAERFFRHQLATSLDWSTSNPLFTFLYGGLNCHVAHHLFPGTSHLKYLELTKMIKKVCVESSMHYREAYGDPQKLDSTLR